MLLPCLYIEGCTTHMLSWIKQPLFSQNLTVHSWATWSTDQGLWAHRFPIFNSQILKATSIRPPIFTKIYCHVCVRVYCGGTSSICMVENPTPGFFTGEVKRNFLRGHVVHCFILKIELLFFYPYAKDDLERTRRFEGEGERRDQRDPWKVFETNWLLAGLYWFQLSLMCLPKDGP